MIPSEGGNNFFSGTQYTSSVHKSSPFEFKRTRTKDVVLNYFYERPGAQCLPGAFSPSIVRRQIALGDAGLYFVPIRPT